MWGDYCIHDVLFDNTSFDLQTIGILRGASTVFSIIRIFFYILYFLLLFNVKVLYELFEIEVTKE